MESFSPYQGLICAISSNRMTGIRASQGKVLIWLLYRTCGFGMYNFFRSWTIISFTWWQNFTVWSGWHRQLRKWHTLEDLRYLDATSSKRQNERLVELLKTWIDDNVNCFEVFFQITVEMDNVETTYKQHTLDYCRRNSPGIFYPVWFDPLHKLGSLRMTSQKSKTQFYRYEKIHSGTRKLQTLDLANENFQSALSF